MSPVQLPLNSVHQPGTFRWAAYPPGGGPLVCWPRAPASLWRGPCHSWEAFVDPPFRHLLLARSLCVLDCGQPAYGGRGKLSGEGGIRTLGRIAPTPVFETGPFNRSGTSPIRLTVTTPGSSGVEWGRLLKSYPPSDGGDPDARGTEAPQEGGREVRVLVHESRWGNVLRQRQRRVL